MAFRDRYNGLVRGMEVFRWIQRVSLWLFIGLPLLLFVVEPVRIVSVWIVVTVIFIASHLTRKHYRTEALKEKETYERKNR